ncbi:MAG: bifunctional DNA-formamidopyrimidine glycosylase/DNA-(apurinic or apyrimidinic site) lyase [Chloroflexota bacterium]
MPELPEVETTARVLRQRIIGATVAGVSHLDWPRMAPNADLERLSTALVGRPVTSIERHGKYLFLGVEGDRWLSLHRKMTGNVIVEPAERPAAAHTHLVVDFHDGRRLAFVDPRKFGRIYLFESSGERAAFVEPRMGPDAVNDLTLPIFSEALAKRRTCLKSLLLDQSALAGVGNLYADESLWLARLHPARRTESLTRSETRRLHGCLQDVLLKAIERRGTSLSDYVDGDGLPGENQHHLAVYGREGQPCPRCGTLIRRQVIVQRGTWVCPRCQKQPRAQR